MKRIIVICEGQTEQEFVNKNLKPNFLPYIDISGTLISHSKGGIVNWNQLKKQIENHLKSDRSSFVTTLIDYYGIQDKHNFPNWSNLNQIKDKFNRLDQLESAMKNDIDDVIQNRFIPYIQLHEFEGLLFINVEAFKIIPDILDSAINSIKEIINNHHNPETINDNTETAPSKRLKYIIPGYNKILHSHLIIEKTGLANIQAKALRFNNWMNLLKSI